MSTPVAYWVAVAIGTVTCVSLCTACRRRPGPWVGFAGRAISVVLAADAVAFVSVPVVDGRWSVQASLPLALCDLALIVAAVACWWPGPNLPVELTYFWGLAGTLQAVVTPDLSAGFPQLEFFEFVVGHLGIVIAALFLVVGLRLRPRRGSVPRVFAITVAYTAFCRWLRLAYRLQLHVPRGGPHTLVATVSARPLAVVHPQCHRCRHWPAAGPGCAVPPPQVLGLNRACKGAGDRIRSAAGSGGEEEMDAGGRDGSNGSWWSRERLLAVMLSVHRSSPPAAET